MQEVKSHEQATLGFPQIANSELSRTHVSRIALSHTITKPTPHTATIFFVLFSLAVGSAITFIVPPLRGPDEIAHFLRIYSYIHGELLPSAEIDGRKGTFVKRELYHKLHFFKTAGEQFATARQEGLRYGQIMRLYKHLTIPLQDEAAGAAIFAPFAGTEGYNPVAYVPYIAAGVLGEKLDFPQLLLLMRLFGLVAFTAAVAYAIWVIPGLKWSFVVIALLPVSLYNRSVLSADGAALSSAMVITALFLRSAARGPDRPWKRSLWMSLCALSKQAQIIFVLLELIVSPMKTLRQRWRGIAAVVLPSLILSPLWVFAVSADIAAWRLQMDEHHPPEHFDPLWKLVYMWDHPFHFPMAMLRAISGWWQRLWQELIGILGWQDVLLHSWTYVMLTVFLILVPLQKMQIHGRIRVTVISGLTAAGYVVLVYLIFFLTYTPVDIDHVRGVQGRYFVIALPVAAIFLASLVNRELPKGAVPSVAIIAAMISGAATVEALFRAHW
jgi:uncharacterized membrane protein